MRMSFYSLSQTNRGSPNGSWIQCARVDEHHALAVIKLDQPCGAREPALAGCLIEIAGVQQIYLEPSCRKIQILFDGRIGTIRNVRRFLAAMGWRIRRHTPNHRSSNP